MYRLGETGYFSISDNFSFRTVDTFSFMEEIMVYISMRYVQIYNQGAKS